MRVYYICGYDICVEKNLRFNKVWVKVEKEKIIGFVKFGGSWVIRFIRWNVYLVSLVF